MAVAPGAAALGVISNRAMVDIYSLAAEDSDTGDTIKAKTDLLQQAFVGGTGLGAGIGDDFAVGWCGQCHANCMA